MPVSGGTRTFWITVLIWPLIAASLIVIVSELANHRWPLLGPVTGAIVFIARGNVLLMIAVFLVGAYAGCVTSAVPIAIAIGWARAKRKPWLPACFTIAIGVEAIIGTVVAISTNLGGVARFLLGSGLVSGVHYPIFLFEPLRPIWSWSLFLMISVEDTALFVVATTVCWWASPAVSGGLQDASRLRHTF
jgi:hypothetical protein